MPAERPDDFGAKLRDARERKGISLREIANRTKISVRVLEALERNDISRLPGGIFSRAFVRAYANEVGLDPEATIHEFVSQFPHDSVIAGHSTSDPIEDTVALESDRRVASTVLWMFIISLPLAGLLLYLGAIRRHAANNPAPVAPMSEPRESEPTRSEPRASEPVPSVAPIEPAGTKPEATVGSGTPRAEAGSSRLRPAPSSLPAPSGTGAPPADAVDASRAAANRVTVGLAARRPVYVSAIADGRTVLSRLLQPGDRASIEVTREMLLTAGDGSALTMTLNGADARPLGKAGELVSTRVTPANFKDYLPNR